MHLDIIQERKKSFWTPLNLSRIPVIIIQYLPDNHFSRKIIWLLFWFIAN